MPFACIVKYLNYRLLSLAAPLSERDVLGLYRLTGLLARNNLINSLVVLVSVVLKLTPASGHAGVVVLQQFYATPCVYGVLGFF